jgi:hypothetical protein
MNLPTQTEDRRSVPRHLRDSENELLEEVAHNVAEVDAAVVRGFRIKGWFFTVFALVAAGVAVYFATYDISVIDEPLRERVEFSIVTAAIVASSLAVVMSVVAALAFRRAR